MLVRSDKFLSFWRADRAGQMPALLFLSATGPGGYLPFMRTWLQTATAMLAFAANSILARFALSEGDIDPVAFTGIRLVSGAMVLALIAGLRSGAIFRPHLTR